MSMFATRNQKPSSSKPFFSRQRRKSVQERLMQMVQMCRFPINLPAPRSPVAVWAVIFLQRQYISIITRGSMIVRATWCRADPAAVWWSFTLCFIFSTGCAGNKSLRKKCLRAPWHRVHEWVPGKRRKIVFFILITFQSLLFWWIVIQSENSLNIDWLQSLFLSYLTTNAWSGHLWTPY